MTPRVGSPDVHTVHTPGESIEQQHDAPASPWTRVLGILVLGSFAAAAKTARAPRRSARRTSATSAQPEAAA